MIDGTRTKYMVDLVYVDPDTGEAFRQGITILDTPHLDVAEAAAGNATMLKLAKAAKREGREGLGGGRLAGPASAYRLRVRRSTRTVTTKLETIGEGGDS